MQVITYLKERIKIISDDGNKLKLITPDPSWNFVQSGLISSGKNKGKCQAIFERTIRKNEQKTNVEELNNILSLDVNKSHPIEILSKAQIKGLMKRGTRGIEIDPLQIDISELK